MKKVILILTAIVLVASGVAAVSAYEAHVINVKAHVENALSVNTSDVNFGTVFPEEWLYTHREVKLSDSACDELIESGKGGDLVAVNFTFYAEWKECIDKTGYYYDGQAWDAGTANFCNWMGDFLYVGFDTTTPDALNMALIGPAAGPPPGAQAVTMPISRLTDCQAHQLYIGIDVPVFECSYNPLTDMLQPDGSYLPKPSGKDDPTFIIPDGTNKYSPMPRYPGYDPDGMDFGIDLKIQVTGIERG
jgi:kynurenine formamidase